MEMYCQENFLSNLTSAKISLFLDGTAEIASNAVSWSESNDTNKLSPDTNSPFSALPTRPLKADAYPELFLFLFEKLNFHRLENMIGMVAEI